MDRQDHAPSSPVYSWMGPWPRFLPRNPQVLTPEATTSSSQVSSWTLKASDMQSESPKFHGPQNGSETLGTDPCSGARRLDPHNLFPLTKTSPSLPTVTINPPAAVRPLNADPSRAFTLFPRLPPEMREHIWRCSLDIPRMHFVKLESSSTTESWFWWTRWPTRSSRLQSWIASSAKGALEADDIAAEVQCEATRGDNTSTAMQETRLVPIAPDKRSDISSYHNLHQQLRTLAGTCRESRAVVNSAVSRPGALRLGNGSLLSIAGSSDIVFLEYSPPDFYGSGCNLAIDPDCPGLDLIRRVAVRYCPSWHRETAPSVCPFCRQAHSATSCRPDFPTHLYQFLARHLPRLEDFYFVDYFVLRKHPKGAGKADALSPAIRCGNQTFYEANPDEWDIKPHVLVLRSWLEDRFVRYAKMSRLARHRDPDKVRFGILACEHAIEPPISVQSKSKPKQITAAECWSRICTRRHVDKMTRRQRPRSARRRTNNSRKRRELEPHHVFSRGIPEETHFIFANDDSNFEFSFPLPPVKGLENLEDLSPHQVLLR